MGVHNGMIDIFQLELVITFYIKYYLSCGWTYEKMIDNIKIREKPNSEKRFNQASNL